MWLSVCCRRSVIEHICRSIFSVFNTLLKNMVFTPKLFNFSFSLYKFKVCRHFLIHKNSFLCKMIIKKACPVTGQAKTYIPPLQHTIICVPITGKPAHPTLNSDCNSGVIFIHRSVSVSHRHRLAETSAKDYSLRLRFLFYNRLIL